MTTIHVITFVPLHHIGATKLEFFSAEKADRAMIAIGMEFAGGNQDVLRLVDDKNRMFVFNPRAYSAAMLEVVVIPSGRVPPGMEV